MQQDWVYAGLRFAVVLICAIVGCSRDAPCFSGCAPLLRPAFILESAHSLDPCSCTSTVLPYYAILYQCSTLYPGYTPVGMKAGCSRPLWQLGMFCLL